MASSRKRFLGRVLALATTVLVCLLLVEGALRVVFLGSLTLRGMRDYEALAVAHPKRGWTPAPGRRVSVQTLDYAVTMEMNSKGLRDREHNYAPAPGVFRILVLGDSYMEADQVDLDAAMPTVLEESLAARNVEIINMGATGYGTTQELLYLEEEGVKYAPDLVLLGFHSGNDVRNNHRPLEAMLARGDDLHIWGRPYAHWNAEAAAVEFEYPDFERLAGHLETRHATAAQERASRSWLQRTFTYALAGHAIESHRTRASGVEFDPNVLFGAHVETYVPEAARTGGVSQEDYRRLWDEAWDITSRLMLAMQDVAEAQGARFAVFTVPSKLQTDPAYREYVQAEFPGLEWDLGRTERRLAALGQAHGFLVLDLQPAFDQAQRRAGLFHRLRDRHWNRAGHRVAAATLAELLDRHGLLPSPR